MGGERVSVDAGERNVVVEMTVTKSVWEHQVTINERLSFCPQGRKPEEEWPAPILNTWSL